jgi:hypothetical protein
MFHFGNNRGGVVDRLHGPSPKAPPRQRAWAAADCHRHSSSDPESVQADGFAVYKAHQLCQWPAVFCDDNFLATSDSRKKTGKMRLGFVDIHRRRWHEPISSLVFRLSHTENSWERELDLYFVGG